MKKRKGAIALAAAIASACGAAPSHAYHQEHLPPDVGAAKLWLRNRQPDLWRERQEVNVTGTVAHRLAQMSPDERGAFALSLVAQAKQRLIDAGVIIEHEPEPAPDDQPEAEPEERGLAG
jgi:hypothetical protein